MTKHAYFICEFGATDADIEAAAALHAEHLANTTGHPVEYVMADDYSTSEFHVLKGQIIYPDPESDTE